MSVKLIDPKKDNLTATRVAGIIEYLQQRKMWVTSQELQQAIGAPNELVYYVLTTLSMLDMVELGNVIAGRGRPKLAAQWIGRRTSTGRIQTALVHKQGSNSGQAGLARKVAELERANGPSEKYESNGPTDSDLEARERDHELEQARTR